MADRSGNHPISRIETADGAHGVSESSAGICRGLAPANSLPQAPDERQGCEAASSAKARADQLRWGSFQAQPRIHSLILDSFEAALHYTDDPHVAPGNEQGLAD
jgi:hypothetical protein